MSGHVGNKCVNVGDDWLVCSLSLNEFERNGWSDHTDDFCD